MPKGAEFQRPQPEVPIFPERVVITPDALLEDNHSNVADEKRTEWYGNKASGQLWKVRRCADARGIVPPLVSIDSSSIATGGPQEPYNKLFASGVTGIINLTHYAGDKLTPGKEPEGCGGLDAKNAQLKNGAPTDTKGVQKFVKDEISHHDPLIQTWISAERIAAVTGKPVLAATQDHERGNIYPVAVFTDGARKVTTALLIRRTMEGQYDPKEIYGDGIPTLDDNELPEEFQEFLKHHREYLSSLQTFYPDLHERLKVQNPPMVLITTEKIPARVRYPMVFEKPGFYFQVHIPRDKNEQIVRIEQVSIDIAIAQAQYAIEQAMKNHDTPKSPFSRVNTVLIETGDQEQSVRIANALKKNEWMRDWMNIPEHQVLVAMTVSGITRRMEAFR